MPMKHVLFRLLLATAILLAPASVAQNIAKPYLMVNQSSRANEPPLVLTVRNSSILSGTPVILQQFEARNRGQIWIGQSTNNGYQLYSGLGNQLALSAKGGGANADPVVIYPAQNSASFQLWNYNTTSQQITSNLLNGSMYALNNGGQGAQVVAGTAGSGPAAQWQLWPTYALETVLNEPDQPLPIFQNDQLTAYNYISDGLLPPVSADGTEPVTCTLEGNDYTGVRCEYNNLAESNNISTWSSQIRTMTNGSGASDTDFAIVQQQLQTEMGDVASVQGLYSQFNQFYTAMFEQQSDDVNAMIAAAQLQTAPDQKVNVKGATLSVLEGVTYTILSAVGTAGGVIGNLMETATNAAAASRGNPGVSISPFQVEVAALWQQLSGDFKTVLMVSGNQEESILSDWGRMQAVATMIVSSGPDSLAWPPTATGNLVSAGQPGFEIAIMQMLLPAQYRIYAMPDLGVDQPSEPRSKYVPWSSTWAEQAGYGMTDYYYLGNINDYKEALQVPANPASCPKGPWTSFVFCNGVTPHDFYHALNGWQGLQTVEYGVNGVDISIVNSTNSLITIGSVRSGGGTYLARSMVPYESQTYHGMSNCGGHSCSYIYDLTLPSGALPDAVGKVALQWQGFNSPKKDFFDISSTPTSPFDISAQPSQIRLSGLSGDGFTSFQTFNVSVTSGPSSGIDVAANASALTSFNDSFGDHAVYFDTDGHIHQSFVNTSGAFNQDLTAMTSGQTASAGSGLSSFADGDEEHVFYVDGISHLHQLNFQNLYWTDQDMTASNNGPLAFPTTKLTSCFDYMGEYVFYLDALGNIQQLFGGTAGAVWDPQNLTASAESMSTAAPGSSLTSFCNNNDASEHIFYFDSAGHVHRLYWVSGSRWSDTDLTSSAGSQVVAAAGSSLSSFLDNAGEHVLYIDGSGDVHQIDGSATIWTDQDLTLNANAVKAASGTGLTSFSDGAGDHVFYIGVPTQISTSTGQLGAPGQIMQLYAAPSSSLAPNWTLENLTIESNSGTTAVAGSSLSGYSVGPNNENNIFYLDDGNYLNRLWWNGKAWQAGILPPQVAVATSALTSFNDSFGDHAVYSDTDGHIHQSFVNTNGAFNQDLTVMAGGQPASAGSGLSSFADGDGEHVFYVDGISHLHQLNFQNSSWKDQDMTASNNGPLAFPTTKLTSCFDYMGEYVFYLDALGNIQQLFGGTAGAVWDPQNLTANAGPMSTGTVSTAAPGSSLTSFCDGNDASEHIFYLDSVGHVHLLYWVSGSPWFDLDLTSSTGSQVVAVVGSSLSSFLDNAGQHVLYIDGSGDVHQIDSSGTSWTDQDLTLSANAVKAASGTGLTSFSDNAGEHVFYVGVPGQVMQLYAASASSLAPNWSLQNLTIQSNSGTTATAGSSLSGYSVGHNDENIFYLDAENYINRLWWNGTAWQASVLPTQ